MKRNHNHTTLVSALIAATAVLGSLAPLGTRAGETDDRSNEIEAWLQEFDHDSTKRMNKHLPKWNSRGETVESTTAFSLDEVATRDYVSQRDRVRRKTCGKRDGVHVCLEDLDQADSGRAGFTSADDARDLVDDLKVSNLLSMEKQKLKSAKLAESPWSDDYWAIYKGITAHRYADDNHPGTGWKDNFDYSNHPDRVFKKIVESRNSSSIDMLSPAEKYDLLVGDMAGTLTKQNWAEGKRYFDRDGSVETWMGICHGWAPAAYMLPRPTSLVTALAADGRTKVGFYPSDIKALTSLLWANAHVDTRFAGGRCNEKDPAQDENGRTKDAGCFDNNPGTWHLAIVNQIGLAKRSFVMDATYDYEVWNQPVHAYSYSYFNPETSKASDTFSGAKVSKTSFKKDKFASYRSSKAESIVGVAMDVTYVVETQPNHNPTDTADRDGLRSVRYMYDLELDKDGEIIGGEWYTNLHPDFLWTPAADARAVSSGDSYATGPWEINKAMPKSWSAAAARASNHGQPLAKVIEALITESRLGR